MTLSPEAIRGNNEAYLYAAGIAVNPALPYIESSNDVAPRSSAEVAPKLVALSYTIRIGYGYPISDAKARLTSLGVLDILGSTTLEILNTGKLTEQQKIDLKWQAEAAQAIAWALNLADLDNTQPCDEDLADRLSFGDGEQRFIQTAQRRSLDDIQEQVDLVYLMHWYAVNCRLTGKDCALNESVVRERRRALDWIYGVAEDWDEIPMDT